MASDFPVERDCLLLGRCGGLGFGQRLLGRLDQLIEGLGLRERELREGLPVQFDLGPAESVHKSVIRNPAQVAGRVDADDPHPAVVALLVLAAEVRVLAGAHDGFLAGAEQLAPARAESLRALQDLLVALFAVRTALLTRHGSSLNLLLKHDPDVLGVVLPIELTPAAHLTTALGFLARHDVPLPGGAEQHLPGRGDLEALLRALVGLLLRHSSFPSFVLPLQGLPARPVRQAPARPVPPQPPLPEEEAPPGALRPGLPPPEPKLRAEDPAPSPPSPRASAGTSSACEARSSTLRAPPWRRRPAPS